MYQIITKAINTTTKVVLYEGVKKEYETYLQAARDLKCVALYPRGKMCKVCSSYRVPENYDKNVHAYASWNHWGSIRTTLYIKKL
jgi:hypothetical protein